jgi:lipoprotein Spr
MDLAYFCNLIRIVNIVSILFLVNSFSFAGNSKKNPKRLNDSLNQEYTDEERLLGYFYSRNIVLDSCYNYALYKTVINWLGTNYQFAGETNRGIDCSGFATVLYKEAFGINLSGGSYDIIKQVDTTFKNKSDLKVGDLVFFTIYKKRVSHVGVYIGGNKFAHSSTRAGVIISDLDEPYYLKYYYKSGRFNLNQEK